jgi:hypothetical protein
MFSNPKLPNLQCRHFGLAEQNGRLVSSYGLGKSDCYVWHAGSIDCMRRSVDGRHQTAAGAILCGVLEVRIGTIDFDGPPRGQLAMRWWNFILRPGFYSIVNCDYGDQRTMGHSGD